MQTISDLLATGLLAWFAMLALLIGVRMLRGDIQVRGFLTHRSTNGHIEPERLVVMAVFPLVLASYTFQALNLDVGAMDQPSLPDVPEYFLTLLTSGNALYLAGKIARA